MKMFVLHEEVLRELDNITVDKNWWEKAIDDGQTENTESDDNMRVRSKLGKPCAICNTDRNIENDHIPNT